MRFKMTSHDVLCGRSMQVVWESENGQREEWSSFQSPVCGWFEAEKVLPASVSNVRVSFKAYNLARSFDVNAVDRHDRCCGLIDQSGADIIEVFQFNGEPVDVTFELRGIAELCYVSRAWNAESLSAAPWEYWEHLPSRPAPRPSLVVLQVADAAAAPRDLFQDPLDHYDKATKRLVAAAKALQNVRRYTLAKLRRLDKHLTGQWMAVNSGTTVGAGLAIASAAALFVSPPVGVGLGISSVAASGAAGAADVAADHHSLEGLRHSLCDDDASAFAVADLQCEWVQAKEDAYAQLVATGSATKTSLELGRHRVHTVQAGLVMANTAVVIAEMVEGSTAGVIAAESLAPLMPAARALGVVGAVLSTGVAVHGWATTKTLQTCVRRRIADIGRSICGVQRWIAAMDEMECCICLLPISSQDEVQSCEDSWHYSHAQCLTQWADECRMQHREVTCPLCTGALAPRTGLLQDLLMEDISTLHPDASLVLSPSEQE